jgi:hypothetical protein
MSKRSRGDPVTLDSFLDILTCMEGVLMLIIISTGIDAAQTKVLVPTPMEYKSSKRPVLIECRSDELFEVPLDDLRRLASEELKRIAQQAKGDSAETLRMMGESKVETDSHRVDLTYALLGQLALVSVPGKGYRLDSIAAETTAGWFGRLMAGINPEEEMLLFLVRDDSFNVFKRARSLAWVNKIECSYEILDLDEPIKFGLGGAVPLAQ